MQAIALMKKFDVTGSIASVLRKSTTSRDNSGRIMGPLTWGHT